jgi:hypothetical protein
MSTNFSVNNAADFIYSGSLSGSGFFMKGRRRIA